VCASGCGIRSCILLPSTPHFQTIYTIHPNARAFWLAGNTPANWKGDLQRKQPLKLSLAQQLEHYTEMIEDNDREMIKNGRQMLTAIRIVGLALAIAGVVSTSYLACESM
jgi:hypothetical protein